MTRNVTLPNSLPQDKIEYLGLVLPSLCCRDMIIDAVLCLYHCEVPVEEAKTYVKTLSDKLDKLTKKD